ncbi:MAG: NAD-dependent epimerase/dehydratase family protein [Solobacterium sp.]|nr:NAD-dependent epimerase/dehydratase family protein [Solobacterium sp.]
MNILITGAKGFVGRNLAENLRNIRDGKDRTRNITVDEIMEYDLGNTEEELKEYCRRADFVFHLAGVNRPKNTEEFMEGNFGFSSILLRTLLDVENRCPIMVSSSIQASLSGRFENSEYGKSKLAGEDLFFDYEKATQARVLVYRFPNLFGKWCRPNYNSAVATFCHNIANDLEIKVNDPNTQLELVYIDDLVNEMILALEGKENRCYYNGVEPVADAKGKYCYVPVSHTVTLDEIVKLLHQFKEQPNTCIMPEMPADSFARKLFSTYLSYLPRTAMKYELKTNSDERGSFTEVIKTLNSGQFSVNVSKPGKIKGQHWHNSKWEIFIVVSGHGLIQERKIGSEEVIEFEVWGNKPEAVYMLPGYTHNIINLSDTEDLITLMYANEMFDKEHPETYYEKVI